jgi:hypothetical protein
MQLNRTSITVLIGVLVIVFVTGFLMGTRVGMYQFLLADAQYKASILSAEIKQLKAGKVASIIDAMEINLDSELANHGRYMESHFTWLFPELIPKDDQVIKRAVAYRLSNPFVSPDLSKPESWNPGINMDDQFVRETIEGQIVLKRHLQKTLDAYEDESHNPPRHGTPDRRP